MTEPITQKTFQKALVDLVYVGKHSRARTFQDFCESSSLALANAGLNPSAQGFMEREESFEKIRERVGNDRIEGFGRALGILAAAMKHERGGTMNGDVLGDTFEALELSNEFAGQYFSPFDVGMVTSSVTMSDAVGVLRDGADMISVYDPTCGCGRMFLAAAEHVRLAGFDPLETMFIVGQDLDPLCVQMSHITLSLMGLKARLSHANTLTLEQYSVVLTPAVWTSTDRQIDFMCSRNPERAKREDLPAAGQLSLF